MLNMFLFRIRHPSVELTAGAKVVRDDTHITDYINL